MRDKYIYYAINIHIKRFTLFFSLMILFLIAGSIHANENEQAPASIEKARINQYIKEQQHQVDDSITKSNVSIIQQLGNNNNASIMQSYAASFQSGNFALIRQKGNNNVGAISQYGGNNAAVIWQVGNQHNASINQRNESAALALNADIRQFGTASDIHITQSGNGPRSISIEHQAYSGNALPVIVENH